MSAGGAGFTRIAKLLNAEGAPAPRAQQNRPTAWAPTSVKEVIDRRLYLGELVWNRTRKRDRWGQHHAAARPEAEWLRQSVPALRIVSDEVWAAAHGRLAGIRAQLGPHIGRRRHDVDSRHLLAGFARCAVCGGSFAAMSRPHGGQRVFRYGCAANYKRGITVCDNNLQMSTAIIDEALLETLGGKVLRPAVVKAILDGIVAEMAPKTATRTLDTFRAELADTDRALTHLSRAIGAGGPLEALLAELKRRQTDRDRLTAAIASHERAQQQHLDRKSIEAAALKQVAEWRALLSTKQIGDGRRLLRECLTAPVRFTPEKRSYRFEGEVGLQKIVGLTADCHLLWRPQGDTTKVGSWSLLFSSSESLHDV